MNTLAIERGNLIWLQSQTGQIPGGLWHNFAGLLNQAGGITTALELPTERIWVCIGQANIVSDGQLAQDFLRLRVYTAIIATIGTNIFHHCDRILNEVAPIIGRVAGGIS